MFLRFLHVYSLIAQWLKADIDVVDGVLSC